MKPPRVFPWLPVGFAIGGDFRVGRVLCEGPSDGASAYQVVDAQADDDRKCALVKPEFCPPEAVRIMDDPGAGFSAVDFPGENIRAAIFAPDASPVKVSDIPLSANPMSGRRLPDLARALAEISGHCWGESLYIPAIGRCVPFGKSESEEERRLLAVRILTGGVADPTLSPQQIHAVNKWIQPEEAAQFFQVLKIPARTDAKTAKARPVPAPEEFVLPGQPRLEKFFRERVIFYHRNREQFEKIGGKPVGAILLYGPPGTGKTFSANAIADFLGWTMVKIRISDIGSQFIHQTSARLKREFDKARKQSPAVLFLDEIDELGGMRASGSQKHEVEEVTTLLTAIESVSASDVFVVAATNRKDDLDPALLSRFYECIEVALPGPDELQAALEYCLSRCECAAGLNLSAIIERLSGCNFRDMNRLVSDATHHAVLSGKDEIDGECLQAAADNIKPPSKPRRVGF